MIDAEFECHVHDFIELLKDTLYSKNVEYADRDDVLANFKETADFLGCSLFESLLPHMHKHYRAIVKGFNSYPEADLRGRLIDLCAYAIFTDIIKKESNARD